jgi:exopolyphosphatase/pppGpp-phosphohydrolase
VQVQVLRKEEEAEFSLLAALESCKPYYQPGEGVLIIDQGGGSTEVACGEYAAEGARFHGLESLDLGTLMLRNRFLAWPGCSARAAYEAVRAEGIRLIESHDFSASLKPVQGRLSTCFAVGAVASYATRRHRSREQHGKRLRASQLDTLCRNLVEKYLREEGGLESWRQGSPQGELAHDLDMMYGLPVYAALLRQFALPELVVCGCGLRYGVFFAEASGHERRLTPFAWP